MPDNHPGFTFVNRVVLKNYRSIAACDVRLGPLTFLVGPNGAGKSNFLDALCLVSASLRSSIEHAMRDRGGINQIRRRSGGHPTDFGIRLDFRLPDGQIGYFAFEVGAKKAGGFIVKQEDCAIGPASYSVKAGELASKSQTVMPPAADDRLYLVSAAGLPEFRPSFDALSRMGFYNIRPETIRKHQEPDEGDLLNRDGSNLASVIRRMKDSSNGTLRRVQEYLSQVVPGIEGVEYKPVGHLETLEFRQQVENQSGPWRFPAINMSDGTLRALSILVALFQPGVRSRVPLIGIEEPEAALHPAAAGVVLDALMSGSRETQVVITSHSPDLLEAPVLTADDILAVEAIGGRTIIGQVDEASRSALSERLYTAGELLRSNQLHTDPTAVPDQLDLFQRIG